MRDRFENSKFIHKTLCICYLHQQPNVLMFFFLVIITLLQHRLCIPNNLSTTRGVFVPIIGQWDGHRSLCCLPGWRTRLWRHCHVLLRAAFRLFVSLGGCRIALWVTQAALAADRAINLGDVIDVVVNVAGARSGGSYVDKAAFHTSVWIPPFVRTNWSFVHRVRSSHAVIAMYAPRCGVGDIFGVTVNSVICVTDGISIIIRVASYVKYRTMLCRYVATCADESFRNA